MDFGLCVGCADYYRRKRDDDIDWFTGIQRQREREKSSKSFLLAPPRMLYMYDFDLIWLPNSSSTVRPFLLLSFSILISSAVWAPFQFLVENASSVYSWLNSLCSYHFWPFCLVFPSAVQSRSRSRICLYLLIPYTLSYIILIVVYD